VVSASSSIISSFRLNEDGSVEEIDSRSATGVPVNPDAANPAAGATGFVDVAETENSDLLTIWKAAQEKWTFIGFPRRTRH
jgi:hypothetical protein